MSLNVCTTQPHRYTSGPYRGRFKGNLPYKTVIMARICRHQGWSYGQILKKFPEIKTLDNVRDIILGRTYEWIPGAVNREFNIIISAKNNANPPIGLARFLPSVTPDERREYRRLRQSKFSVQEAVLIIANARKRRHVG